ncbi:DUF3644 domain-containing protein [Aeromicrobium sp.]|uniref:DUF3644 domain-containing protein n=1 Tax=Aeromicrobium sp. TaxID=1871063 RepID=UPI0019CDD37F|nr:DUF3644 domain-containing protein [Aeromicrobium sp.]MBC7630541.1 DUF3644 domain-containing protein [Aeromicrobium sp.]
MAHTRCWHTMQEARRQACVAVEFYNRSGEKASFYDFVLHMHLAWQNLLHADLDRRGVNTYFRKPNGWYVRDKNGEKQSWDLGTCLKKEFPDDQDPVRANVELFIGLRNKIEHRFQEAFIMETSAYAHALVLNFEAELVKRFSAEFSLGKQLRFPIFVQSLTPEGIKEQKALRRQLPLSARNYITKFEAKFDPSILEDERFIYRVMLTPVKGPKTDADTAFTFVRMDELTAEDQRDLMNKKGTAVVIEKLRSVALKDEVLPKPAAKAVEALIPFRFNVHDFTKMRYRHEVGGRNGKRMAHSRDDYCVWIASTRNWVYTPKYIKKCADELQTADAYIAALGKVPRLKKATTTKVA